MTDFCVWKPILFLNHNASGFDKNDVYNKKKLLSEKNKLKSKFSKHCMTQISLWNLYFFSVIMYRVCTEITSILQKSFPEKNVFMLNSTICLMKEIFFVKIYTFLSHNAGFCKIISILQKLFSERNAVSLNSTAWLTIMHYVLTTIISALQKLFSAKKHVKFKSFTSILYFNELTENSKNYAATVIQIIVRNHFTAFLVHKIYLFSRKHFYWDVMLTEIL